MTVSMFSVVTELIYKTQTVSRSRMEKSTRQTCSHSHTNSDSPREKNGRISECLQNFIPFRRNMENVHSVGCKTDLIRLRETLNRLAEETTAAEIEVMKRIRTIELHLMKSSEKDKNVSILDTTN